MHIVDTPSPSATIVARTSDGKVDLNAYIGLHADFSVGDLTVKTIIRDARTRFGHLDLLITPTSGAGEKWVERKNLVLANDPATKSSPLASFDLPVEDDDTPTDDTFSSLTDEVIAIINRVNVK
jgi:hypothetical protein